MCGNLFDTRAQFGAALADIGKQLFLFHDGKKFQRRGTHQRPATESSSMQPGHKRSGKIIIRQQRPEREPTGQRFRDCYNIRRSVKFLVREIATGAPQAALNFIRD